MITEKEQIERILKERGILVNGAFDETRFNKLVTEPWIYNKTIKYGLNKLNSNDSDVEPIIEEPTDTTEPIEIQTTDNEAVIEELVTETIEETPETVSEVTEETPVVEETIEETPETVSEVTEETPVTTTQSKKKTTKKK